MGRRVSPLSGPSIPDLVVLDVMMPKRNGYEVLEAVRADPSLAGVRVLMLTAKGRPAESEKGLELGADAYMPKPFSTRELVDKAKSLLAEGEERPMSASPTTA